MSSAEVDGRIVTGVMHGRAGTTSQGVLMGKVVFDISRSLDGFVTASNQTAEEPLGAGGETLHDWAFGGDEQGSKLLADAVSRLALTGPRVRVVGRSRRCTPLLPGVSAGASCVNGGTRMFDHLGSQHIRLEPVETIETPVAVHLRFRVRT